MRLVRDHKHCAKVKEVANTALLPTTNMVRLAHPSHEAIYLDNASNADRDNLHREVSRTQVWCCAVGFV